MKGGSQKRQTVKKGGGALKIGLCLIVINVLLKYCTARLTKKHPNIIILKHELHKSKSKSKRNFKKIQKLKKIKLN